MEELKRKSYSGISNARKLWECKHVHSDLLIGLRYEATVQDGRQVGDIMVTSKLMLILEERCC